MCRVVIDNELFLSEVLKDSAEARHEVYFPSYLSTRAQDMWGISDLDSPCCGPWSRSGNKELRTGISPLRLFTFLISPTSRRLPGHHESWYRLSALFWWTVWHRGGGVDWKTNRDRLVVYQIARRQAQNETDALRESL